jgi:hypothetical protein
MENLASNRAADPLETERDRRSASAARPVLPALGSTEWAALLGVPAAEIPPECRALIASHDFAYEIVRGDERDAVLRRVVLALDAELSISGPDRIRAWENGWGDILRRFESSGFDPKELEPHYFRRPSQAMRLFGEYVRPRDPRFEASFVEVIQAFVALRYLTTASAIYEFGCGPGHNLVAFSRWLPGKPLFGMDWAEPSQHILSAAAKHLGIDIVGRRFDMFAPDRSLALAPGAAVVTIGAMEQLGDRFEALLDFFRAAKPRICVHLEPIHELYDTETLFDLLGALYAERRGYLRGYLPRLRELERRGEIEVLHVKRHLGSLFHDGWGSIVWRPTASASNGAPE